MLHPEAALLGAVVENRDRLVDGIADDSGAVPSVVGLLETMAKEFRSRKLSGRGFLAFKVRGRQAREERAEREAQSARCGTFTLLVRAGRGKNYQADNLRCDPEEVFVL